MAQYEFSASSVIKASPKRVYSVIADYCGGHQLILPKPYFVSLDVEKGGFGEGTEIYFIMQLMGELKDFHATVSEPEPGRVLVETVQESGAVTKFIVESCNGGNESHVTISTSTKVREGVLGRIEGWMTKQMLRPIYVKELDKLEKVTSAWKEPQ